MVVNRRVYHRGASAPDPTSWQVVVAPHRFTLGMMADGANSALTHDVDFRDIVTCGKAWAVDETRKEKRERRLAVVRARCEVKILARCRAEAPIECARTTIPMARVVAGNRGTSSESEDPEAFFLADGGGAGA
jgi:hypothetical protein